MKSKVFFLSFLLLLKSFFLFSVSYPLSSYLDLLKEYPSLGPLGCHRKGEIEIVTDSDEIRRIENISYERYTKMGMDSLNARIASQAGIISQDPFWIILRDAVIFPNGTKGLYNRVIEKSSLQQAIGSVVIAPLLPDGRIVVILNYRHATRAWEIELPRGYCQSNETSIQTAIRQMAEETGYKLQSPQIMGYLHPNSSLSSSTTAVIAGFVQEKKAAHLENSEAIKGVLALTKQQLFDSLQRGWIELTFNGTKHRILSKDPYFAYIILMGESKGLWP